MNKKVKCEKINVFSAIIYVFLISAFILSIKYECCEGSSFIVTICPIIKCPVFLRAPAIFEVVKVIGLSNVLIACIYAKLDEKILGLTYSEILHSRFKGYSVYSIIHIILTLCCISLSFCGLTESSLISLAIVSWGFFYQCCIFYKLILNKDKCVKLSFFTWIKKKEKNKENLLNDLLTLAETFPVNNAQHYKTHLECFAIFIFDFTQNDTKLFKVNQLSQVWDRLSKNQNIMKNKYSIQDIFQELFYLADEETSEKVKHCLCEVMSGYIINQICILQEQPNLQCMNEGFSKLVEVSYNTIDNLSKSTSTKLETKTQEELKADFGNCIKTNLYILLWLYFQDNRICMTQQLLNIKPKDKNEKYIDKIVEELFPSFVNGQENIEFALKIAKTQLK